MHNIGRRWFHFPKLHKEVQELYFNLLLRKVAFSMIGIFIPAYLLSLGFDLTQVTLYLIGIFLTWIIVTMAGLSIVSRIGYKKSIMISYFFLFIKFTILYFLSYFPIPLTLMAIVSGISYSFYWLAFNSLFTSYSKKQQQGKEFAYLVALNRMSGIVGPLIGAAILVRFGGIVPLLITVTVLLGLSLVPLFWTVDIKPKKHSWQRFVLSEERIFLYALSQGAVHAVIYEIFPLFIFLNLAGFESLGYMASLTALASAFIGVVMGKLIDKGQRDYFKVGVVATSALLVLLYFIPPGISTFVISFFLGLASTPVFIALDTYLFQRSRKMPVIGNAMREFFLKLGTMVTLSLFLVLNFSFELTFLAVAVLALPLLVLKT